MSLGKSNIPVKIPLNLPNPSYINPLKFSRFRAVVQEYMSKISEFGDFEGWQHSLWRNCVCLCVCIIFIYILHLFNKIKKRMYFRSVYMTHFENLL